MSQTDYTKKYLKYKAKYLGLKSDIQKQLNPLLKEQGFVKEFNQSLNNLNICAGETTLLVLQKLLQETNQLNKRGLEIVLTHFMINRPIEQLVSSLSPSNPNNYKAIDLARKLLNSCSILEKTSFNTKKVARSTSQMASKAASATGRGLAATGRATGKGLSTAASATGKVVKAVGPSLLEGALISALNR